MVVSICWLCDSVADGPLDPELDEWMDERFHCNDNRLPEFSKLTAVMHLFLKLHLFSKVKGVCSSVLSIVGTLNRADHSLLSSCDKSLLQLSVSVEMIPVSQSFRLQALR